MKNVSLYHAGVRIEVADFLPNSYLKVLENG